MQEQLDTIRTKVLGRLANRTLLEKREAIQTIVTEATELKAAIDNELRERITTLGTDGKLPVGEQTVVLVKRPVFSGVTLATAQRYDAVKAVVDTTKLLLILSVGKKIRGVKFTDYIAIK